MKDPFLDCEEYNRWLGQGEHTFSAIDTDIVNRNYDWACFKAQQSAEMSIKAVLKAMGIFAFGHGLLKLYNDCEQRIGKNDKVKDSISYLDKMYMSPRYPDAFSEGAPWEHFTRGDAELASSAASTILNWAKAAIPECL
ncbi:MAG: HEPN domain-containing protein [Thermoplasmataceae archaeon]